MRPNEGISNRLVALLATMAGISVANLYYCQPLLNMIRQDLTLTEFQVNLMPVCTQIGYALGLMFIIPMGDLYNRRTTILTCFVTLVASLLTISLSHHAVTLLAASFVTGVFSVAPQVFMPFVSQMALPHEKERKTGAILSGLLVGILASRVVSGYVGHWLDWRTMYQGAAVLIALSALVTARAFPHVEPTFHGRFTSLMASLWGLAKENPRALTYAVRSGLAFGSFLGLWGCLAFRMKEAPFFQDSDTVGLLGLCGVAGVLTASRVGRYIPRYGVERFTTIGLGLMTMAWLVIGAFQDTYTGIILAIVVIDIGMQFIQLANQSATMRLRTDAASRLNTIFMVTYFIGGSLGTFLAGTMWSLWGWWGTVTSGLTLLAIAAVFSALRTHRRSQC